MNTSSKTFDLLTTNPDLNIKVHPPNNELKITGWDINRGDHINSINSYIIEFIYKNSPLFVLPVNYNRILFNPCFFCLRCKEYVDTSFGPAIIDNGEYSKSEITLECINHVGEFNIEYIVKFLFNPSFLLEIENINRYVKKLKFIGPTQGHINELVKEHNEHMELETQAINEQEWEERKQHLINSGKYYPDVPDWWDGPPEAYSDWEDSNDRN